MEILYNLIIYPIYQIIEITYMLFNKTFHNSGIAVIGVSITVTLLSLPLYIVVEKLQNTERIMQKNLAEKKNKPCNGKENMN